MESRKESDEYDFNLRFTEMDKEKSELHKKEERSNSEYNLVQENGPQVLEKHLV